MEVATNILARARELGLALKAEGGAIAVRPKGAMPPELAAAIRAHKPRAARFPSRRIRVVGRITRARRRTMAQ